MERINRDVIIAIILLLICGLFFWSSFDIRLPDYGSLRPSTWPRVIIAALTVLSLIYLVQSLNAPREAAETPAAKPRNVREWLANWRNVIWCFVLFFAYLMSLPILGMLIGGMLFVFLLLCALGSWSLRHLALHAAIAIATVGGMWSLFTFGLGVILPPGEILKPF